MAFINNLLGLLDVDGSILLICNNIDLPFLRHDVGGWWSFFIWETSHVHIIHTTSFLFGNLLLLLLLLEDV